MSNTLVEYLKQLRKEKNITAEELGNMIGYSQSHISGVENGLKNLNGNLLTKYIKALSNDDIEKAEIENAIKNNYEYDISSVKNADFFNNDKTISLNDITGYEFFIDGEQLSNREMKLILTLIRGYRQI
ncbi:helix-turn-helix domain-containing protein [Mammaliicoccus vitulinus]|uniref:helix-turn-helix domain-containing protein n=1 Tax=Mammaliicoccus vitulinus TaxID=71237 RepID=UPI002B261F25|nr:helix-turn-helix domain-containing protein [Mammaliicoccus vitulinus]WQK87041.1 helix-turn-helix domain-containing protein [Mammaliicoccus vitulinus]